MSISLSAMEFFLLLAYIKVLNLQLGHVSIYQYDRLSSNDSVRNADVCCQWSLKSTSVPPLLNAHELILFVREIQCHLKGPRISWLTPCCHQVAYRHPQVPILPLSSRCGCLRLPVASQMALRNHCADGLVNHIILRFPEITQNHVFIGCSGSWLQ